MANRRKNGEGSFRRTDKGKLEYRITYRDEYGVSRRKSFYGKNEAECYKQAELFRKVQEMSKYTSDIYKTIPDILRGKYKEDFEMNFISEAAYYRNLVSVKMIEKHPLGSIPIINVNDRHIEGFMKTITSCSNSVIAKTHQQIRLAYEIAVDEGLVGKNLMNSRKLSRRPRSTKKDRVVKGFTEQEQEKFMAALESDKVPGYRNNFKNQIKIELYTGLRMGEVNALRREDIDFSRGVIHVRRTVAKGLQGRPYINERTKTETGTRDVPINELVRPVLEDALSNSRKNRYGLIFLDINRRDVIKTEQVNSYFRKICRKAGIEPRGQHSLRHTFATRCIEAGVSAVVLKNWMGHTDIHVTLDTYADVFSSMNNGAVRQFEEHMFSM